MLSFLLIKDLMYRSFGSWQLTAAMFAKPVYLGIYYLHLFQVAQIIFPLPAHGCTDIDNRRCVASLVWSQLCLRRPWPVTPQLPPLHFVHHCTGWFVCLLHCSLSSYGAHSSSHLLFTVLPLFCHCWSARWKKDTKSLLCSVRTQNSIAYYPYDECFSRGLFPPQVRFHWRHLSRFFLLSCLYVDMGAVLGFIHHGNQYCQSFLCR